MIIYKSICGSPTMIVLRERVFIHGLPALAYGEAPASGAFLIAWSNTISFLGL